MHRVGTDCITDAALICPRWKTTPWNLHAKEESFTIGANARNALTHDRWFTGTTTQDYPKTRKRIALRACRVAVVLYHSSCTHAAWVHDPISSSAVVLLHFVVIRRHMTTR